MAWLNLIKHIDWDIETSNIGITPPNNYDLPFRESFRTSIYKQEKIKFRHGKQKKFICHSC